MAACTAADRLAICWSALGKVAGKRSNRDLLTDGAAYPVDLEISGKIGRGCVSDRVVGTLHVGEEQRSSTSSACDQAELLACVAAALTKPQRDRLFTALAEGFHETGALPTPRDPNVVAECQLLIGKLRATVEKINRGNVTFELAKPA